MGLGAVLLHPEGHRHALSAVAPGTGCNNEAELRALGLGLAEAKALGATELRVFSDNSVLVEQLGRRGQRPILRLARLIEAMRHELDALAWWRLEWIPRHRNREADALARAALGLAAGDRTKPKHRSGSARP
ncbi:MAG: reverse transcriptase-like protein [Comamonadaceae bacterium]|nr:MAG: reverse transcriptase-like protein [Comamonadaceae bacterium]